MAALVFADHDNATLNPATRNAITAARQMDSTVHILVTGAGCAAVAKEAAQISDVDKVLLCQSAALANLLPENVAPLLVQLAEDYDFVVAPATSNGKNVLPRVAALLDVSQISEISAVVSEDTFERPIYAGNATAVVRSCDRRKVVTVRGTKFAAAGNRETAAPVDEISYSSEAGVSTFVANKITTGDRPELTTASVVVSGGRGMGSKESFDLLTSLADRLHAAVGASRAAVDAGFAPSDSQVGQTGKVVAPDLYVAVGISGAIQHLAGMKDSKTIVAINKDPEAPIFQLADVGFVGDLFEVLPQLTAALEKR
ncbi:electron transfer flavoprotein subunit alpha/FixB family protein [Paraburkholderia kirstenboschensis]|uniref:Electron transfer flavoprotein subunit alpha/FixB family protein n=1 Tax=Paraburkholderia kirstenboschensis TaxID=1245436 RepID=A0ABZ0EK67_9BURK|nr:electron transfer flavoprotein subunit alpha/FixB family protein [Paraburkholderia kirstenboschensis]WOD16970.1 electron transfer flavoprotein subunit alpha/FixB family protein [Paraburkholderia kirstenboschensis]